MEDNFEKNTNNNQNESNNNNANYNNIEGKEPKKKSTALVIIIILLCVLILALIGIIALLVINNRETKEDNKNSLVIYDVNTTNTNATNSSSEEQEVDELVEKIDNGKDWVYPAEYEKSVVKQSYKDGYGDTYLAENIVAPFININSTYANESNKEIKKIFDKAVKIYNDAAKESLNTTPESFYPMDQVESCNYKRYINDNYLSVVMIYQAVGTANIPPEYYIYNIDLKTGNKLSYEEVYTKAGFDSKEIDSKVEAVIKKKIESEFSEEAFVGEIADRDTSIKNTIQEYKDAVNDGTLQYFLTEDNKLNINIVFHIPVESGEIPQLITIE